MSDDTQPIKKKKKRGRPSNASIAAKTKGTRGEVGRPKGDASAIKDFKARLLASPKSRRVLDDHKNQSAAWKLLVDRLMPLSYFEKDKMGGGKAAVNITITGVGGDIQSVGGEVIDNEE